MFFNWKLLFEILAIIFICLIPLFLYFTLREIQKIIEKKYNNVYREINELNPTSKDCEEKINKLIDRKNKLWDKSYKIDKFCSSGWTFFAYGAGALIAFVISLSLILAIPSDIKFYKNWEETKIFYEAKEHPTFLECQEAEEENEKYNQAFFVKEEFRNKKELIDTELIWSRFEGNIKERRE